MQIELRLSREDAQLLCDLLRQRIREMDIEINRTDSLEFKSDLRRIDRSLERVLGQLSAALELDDGSVGPHAGEPSNESHQ